MRSRGRFAGGRHNLEQIIYSKYSNERAKQFRIRTDITADAAGVKKVYKYALLPEGYAHIAQLGKSYEKLTEAYQTSKLIFCPCMTGRNEEGAAYARFPFLSGMALYDVIKELAAAGEDAVIEGILKEYIRRIKESGGNQPFVVTEEFEKVFGVLSAAERRLLTETGRDTEVSAGISDVDMIFSNLLVEAKAEDIITADWQVIDYEWTFDFPIPKGFLIYRGLYFAYYQILCHSGWSLPRLLALADINEEKALVYQGMEERFQRYLAAAVLPVRNMQQAFGTRLVTLEELLAGAEGAHAGGNAAVPEERWLHVKKIQYHIDRNEYQDGSYVCSGWAAAATWDGRHLPVNIEVTDEKGNCVPVQIRRRERWDVAAALRVRRVTKPQWGFDCVWLAPPDETWKICFSLGKKSVSAAAGAAACDACLCR